MNHLDTVMSVSPVAFFLFAGGAVGLSLCVLFARTAVLSAFALVGAFFCFAAIFALLDAHLLAAMQILVYAGAIMVLFVFVIMLLNADLKVLQTGKERKILSWVGAIGAAAIVLAMAPVFSGYRAPSAGRWTVSAIEQGGGNTKVLSGLLFSEFVLPFELTSVLLLAAIVGVVAVAMRKKAR